MNLYLAPLSAADRIHIGALDEPWSMVARNEIEDLRALTPNVVALVRVGRSQFRVPGLANALVARVLCRELRALATTPMSEAQLEIVRHGHGVRQRDGDDAGREKLHTVQSITETLDNTRSCGPQRSDAAVLPGTSAMQLGFRADVTSRRNVFTTKRTHSARRIF
jgi:hypothetical protein